MTPGHPTLPRPRRAAIPRHARLLVLAAAALGACAGNNQTEAIPPGSATLGPAGARVEQHYTASLGTATLTSAIRPHWTFTFDASASGTSSGVEEPVVRMSVFHDALTIPATADIPLGGGGGAGSAFIETDSDCSQGQVCSLGFKVRFERLDADPSDVAVSWSGTVHTAVAAELGDTSPGDLVVTVDQ